MADLKGIFESTREGIINERDAKIAAGKERERQWLKRTQEFMSKIEFLNNYGFGFYISVENETGCCSYPNEKRVYIRSKHTHGYINVRANGIIRSCCYTGGCNRVYNTAEDFVRDLAKHNS